MPSFAEFVLVRMPKLARRLARKDVSAWLAGQDCLLVDGQRRWLIWGDRLVDEAEMKLGWARDRGLVDPVRLTRLEREYGMPDADVEAIEIAPIALGSKENDDE
jgi:hypothetical protein